MEARELQRAVEAYAEDREDFDYGNVWDDIYYADARYGVTKFTLPEYGEVEKVESWGGEGDGAEMYVVIKCQDRLFQMVGSYSSWDSNYWDGTLSEVESYVEPKVYYRRKA